MMRKRKPAIAVLLVAASAALAAPAAIEPPKLLVDVDFFDNIELIRPYCGSNWIDRFFANCKARGVKRVTWRCVCQVANYQTKLDYRLSQLHEVRSAADERTFDGAFAVKVGVGPQTAGREAGGIRQLIEPKGRHDFLFRGMLSSDAGTSGAFLAVLDAETGRIIARSGEVRDNRMLRREVRFTAERPFYVGAYSAGAEDTQVFVADNLSLRALDAPDMELVRNGGMEEFNDFIEPSHWSQDGARFALLNGDVMALSEEKRRELIPNAYLFKLFFRPRTWGINSRVLRAAEDGDSLALAGKAALKYGIELYAWFDPFDDGWRCLPPVKCCASRFMEDHPEFRCTDKTGRPRWGLLCFACPEVRAHKTDVVRELLSYEGVAGVALKTHYQHNRLPGLDEKILETSIYHPAIQAMYHERWGIPRGGEYNLFRMRLLHGEAVMGWMREMRPLFKGSGKRLCMFQAPRPFLDAGATGGWYLPPERIIEDGLCDDFLIEPRWRDGRHLEHFVDEDNVRWIVNLCRKAGVGVGLDLFVPGITKNWPKEKQGEELYRQLTGLARENLDHVGIYEEMNIHGFWDDIARAAETLAKMPQRESFPPYAVEPENLITLESCSEITLTDGKGTAIFADELVVPNARFAMGLRVPPTGARLTLKFAKPLALSEVDFHTGGYNARKGRYPVEDFILEGLSGGEWRKLAEVTGGNALKGNNQLVPNVCRFTRQPLEGIRFVILRGADPDQLLIRYVSAR